MRMSLLILLLFFFSCSVFAADKALFLNIKGPINPATVDFVNRHIKAAVHDNVGLIVLEMDKEPRGVIGSIKNIHDAILNSSIPVITYVTVNNKTKSIIKMPPQEQRHFNLFTAPEMSPIDFIKKINQQDIQVQNHTQKIVTTHLQPKEINPDLRYAILTMLTHPDLVYVLILLAIYGLFLELSSPGLIIPGLVGTLSLILVIYAFQLLPVNYTGFTLLLAGLAFISIEVYVATYGIIGLMGLVAFIVGSLMLFDTKSANIHLTLGLVFIMAVISFVFFYYLLQIITKAHGRKVMTGIEGLINAEGTVASIQNKKIIVRIQGELWEAQTVQPVAIGQRIKVKEVKGLVLIVAPI